MLRKVEENDSWSILSALHCKKYSLFFSLFSSFYFILFYLCNSSYKHQYPATRDSTIWWIVQGVCSYLFSNMTFPWESWPKKEIWGGGRGTWAWKKFLKVALHTPTPAQNFKKLGVRFFRTLGSPTSHGEGHVSEWITTHPLGLSGPVIQDWKVMPRGHSQTVVYS